jgi:hypothetical protein
MLKCDNQLCFVQFIHPGKEHKPKFELEEFPWNKEEHKRKFLKSSGRYVSEDGKVCDEKLLFWGEWESQSSFERIRSPIFNGPRYIHEPFYREPASYDGLQNTDPFVFGKNFYYTVCQQYWNGRPSQLRYLQEGSIILFGSCLNKSEFVLDTVFVVRGYKDYDRNNYSIVLKEEISKTYEDVTILPIFMGKHKETVTCVKGDSEGYRLYIGATFEERQDDMYSFFPCQICKDGTAGFKKPTIHIKDIVTDNLNQGKKLNRNLTKTEVKQYWDDVVCQVTAQSLLQGIFAELPKER